MNALIVEDNLEAQTLFELQFRSFGYDITSCVDAESALLAYRQAFYQLIILDLGLPGMDGFEFCRRIRALPGRDRSMILVITAYDTTEALEAALEAGADDYLVKPVNFDLLKMRITIIEQQLQNRIRRKQAEEALRESEETARALLNAPTDAVVLIDPKGIVLDMNRTTAYRLGTSIEEIIGSCLWDCFPPDVGERGKARVEKVIQSGEFSRFEGEWQELWYDTVIYPIFDVKGRVSRLAVIARNITERKHAEEELAKYREHLEEIIEERTAKLKGTNEQLQQEIIERKRIEQALQVSEGQYRSLAEDLADRNISEYKLREIAMKEKQEQLRRENTLKSSIKDRYRFEDIIGKSSAMQKVYEQILRAAAADFTVTIWGESGTGKELIARTIHHLSERQQKTFVPVNCGAIPENLFESLFFGHRKGSFTGAHQDQQGFFDLAHQGTLFLDEVTELNENMQVKLLRALEDGEYTPVGDNTFKKADARVIAATNRNLKDQVKKGLLRQDFFYRIQVLTITVPPLRERREDIPLLADHFLEQYSEGDQHSTIPGKIMGILCKYEWPGNVRELQNVLQRYLTTQRLEFSGSETVEPIVIDDISDIIHESQKASALREALEMFEKNFILSTLEQHNGHREKTAKTLGIPTRTLHRKMRKYQII